jgi:hypothetical protein
MQTHAKYIELREAKEKAEEEDRLAKEKKKADKPVRSKEKLAEKEGSRSQRRRGQ